MNTHQQHRQDAAHSNDRARLHARLFGFYQRVRLLTIAPQPDLARIAEVILEEVAFRELVLRVVNSTRTGLFHPIESVIHAVTLLGAAGVLALVEAELDRLGEPWHGRADEIAPVTPESTVTLLRGHPQPPRARSA